MLGSGESKLKANSLNRLFVPHTTHLLLFPLYALSGIAHGSVVSFSGLVTCYVINDASLQWFAPTALCICVEMKSTGLWCAGLFHKQGKQRICSCLGALLCCALGQWEVLSITWQRSSCRTSWYWTGRVKETGSNMIRNDNFPKGYIIW